MSAGYTRTEAGAVPVSDLPNVWRSIALRSLNRLREALVVARLASCEQAYNAIMRVLDQEEARLGRRLLSALDNATNARVRRRLGELRTRSRRGPQASSSLSSPLKKSS